jgi:hypothetical protein
MTAQIGEKLIYKGNGFRMAAKPLYSYLQTRIDIKFSAQLTLNHSGYSARWEIEDNKLYLIGLSGKISVHTYNEKDDNLTESFYDVDLSYVFPEQERVFAEWVSQVIRVPYGGILDYVHHGFGTLFEKDIFLTFVNGILVNEYEKDNHEELLRRQIKRQKEKEQKELKKIEDERLRKAKIKENRKLFWRKLFGIR